VRLIRGDEVFKETIFAHVFSIHKLRCLCSNCLYINQIKLCLCFEKFYDFYLGLIAVLKNLPIIGDFPLVVVVVVVVGQ
jgi:hypothetical protein